MRIQTVDNVIIIYNPHSVSLNVYYLSIVPFCLFLSWYIMIERC